jgi:hypothetical protein
MPMKSTVVAAVASVLLAASTTAFAQTAVSTSQVFLSLNGTYQSTSNDFRNGGVLPDRLEDGRFDADYDVASGPSFAASGGARMWRRVGVGVGVSHFSRSTPAVLEGSVPHPFFFDRPRSVDGKVVGLDRKELALHLQVRGELPINGRLQLSVFGGPSWFRVTQGLVRRISYTEAYPYDEVLFNGATTSSEAGSALGFNVGVDTAIFFTRHSGIGLLVQYSGAKVDLPSVGDGLTNVNAGGIQSGAGLRLRF